MLLDSHTVALEADIAFRDASPRILPAEQLLSKTAPYLPATERELVTLLVAARALLSSPSIPSLLPAVSDRLLSPPCCPPVPVPVPPAPRRTTRTPPRYSPPRMAIADLTTSPHSTSHPKRSSSGGGSPGKRLAIDVHAWRSGESGAALFDLSIDRADDRCCSPTEIDTPTPSETARSAGRSKAEALANHKLEADETSGSCRASPLQAEETLRPGRLAFREEETVMPGALTLQPAWKEERFGPTATMQPSTSASTMHFKRLSLHQPATVSCGALKLRSRALAIASAAVDSTGMATGNERLDDATELKLEDYLGVLVERKLRVVLVSSAEMDGAVEAIRAGHS
ncbi:hypothetical protein CspeluHIS016_0700480 [Cutaneotrichosporon spelunceum]|uniref:Uncharacterized protein n=1 Tax=Cutaneotrichosporon spelunceum TaxID=1672016 RepID=A0AAD3YED2_9TREE|nr:hypothetical protein CspeluHIS016_0700480 [Cutaneotrichosporon spelunceum]